MELGVLGVFWDPNRGFKGWSMLRKFLCSKEHLDLLKIDFNVAEIIIVQDYNKKKINVSESTHMQSSSLESKR